MMNTAAKLLLATKIAEAIQSKYNLSTGYQLTEESVETNELVLTIAEQLDGI
jgi:hypothetical protein